MTQATDDPPARGADIIPFRRPTSPVPAPLDDFGDDVSDDSDDDGPSAA